MTDITRFEAFGLLPYAVRELEDLVDEYGAEEIIDALQIIVDMGGEAASYERRPQRPVSSWNRWSRALGAARTLLASEKVLASEVSK